MNILFIIPSLTNGGAERVTAVLASELSKKHNVCVLIHRDHGRYDISDDVSIIDLRLREYIFPIGKIYNFLKAIHEIKKIKRSNKIDCSISMLETTNFENACTKVCGKTVISVRSLYSKRKHGMIKKAMVAIANYESDQIVSLSNGVYEDLVNNYSVDVDKLITIYNPCNISKIREKCLNDVDSEYRQIRDKHRFIFASAGRMIPEKGQWHLIKSFSRIIKENKDCCLVIFGQGELEYKLKKLAKDLCVEENIFFMGFKENIYPFLYKTDAFVFSSIVEGFGNILIEAMASGLPIICADYQTGGRELLEDSADDVPDVIDGYFCAKYGMLVEPLKEYNNDSFMPQIITKDEIALSNAMKLLLNDEKLRIHYQKQSEIRVEKFDISSIVSDWERIICG